jgi:hypothetical protein
MKKQGLDSAGKCCIACRAMKLIYQVFLSFGNPVLLELSLRFLVIQNIDSRGGKINIPTELELG